MSATTSSALRLIDIGANITDTCFRGVYRGKKVHQDDFADMLSRAIQVGLKKIIITSGTKQDTHDALSLINEFDSTYKDLLYTTVGVHPTRCSNEFGEGKDGEKILEELLELAEKHSVHNNGKVVAIGEFGLDYDRLEFCSKEIQLEWFEKQFKLAERTKLPLFLHMRNAEEDFIDMIKKNRSRFTEGVVHSFTSLNAEHLKSILDLNLYIGINGCSLKTQENLDILAQIPLNRLMIETDAPYCEIKPSYPAAKYIPKGLIPWNSQKKERFRQGEMVKTRNEPCYVRCIVDIIAGIKKESPEVVAEQLYQNTCSVFFPNDK